MQSTLTRILSKIDPDFYITLAQFLANPSKNNREICRIFGLSAVEVAYLRNNITGVYQMACNSTQLVRVPMEQADVA